MAGIDTIPGVGQQIRLIANLRWMLFKNSLRNIKGRLQAVSSVILWLMMSGLVIGGSIFFGFATQYIVSHGLWTWLAGLMWIIFLFWQIYPLFAAAVGAQFDFSHLLRFPLRFDTFFALSLIYGLFDPGAVASLFWLFGMWIGLGIARPALLPWGFLVLFVFAAMNLFFARMVFAWLEKWLARRRTREIMGFIFVLILLCFQLIGPAVQHFQHHRAQLQTGWLLTVLSVANVLPPGLAGQSMQFALVGAFPRAAYLLFFLAVYAIVFFWLFRSRVIAQYHGENLSETSVASAPVPSARPAPSSRIGAPTSASAFGWEIPGVSRPVSAVFEKEVRYAFRSGPMLLNFLVPLILVVFFGYTFRMQGGFRHVPSAMIFPFATAYTFLIQINWVFNSFAFESTGIQFFLLSPARFRDILMGKNLLLALMSLVDTLLVLAVVSFMFGTPPAWIVLSTFAALLYGTLGNFAIGNILSVCFPRRMDFGAFRKKNQNGLTMLIALLTEAVFIALGVAVFALARIFHFTSFVVLIFLAFAGVAAIAYRISLGRVDGLAMSHRETLATELCRRE